MLNCSLEVSDRIGCAGAMRLKMGKPRNPKQELNGCKPDLDNEERLDELEDEIDAAIDFLSAPRTYDSRPHMQPILKAEDINCLRQIRALGALQCTRYEAAAVLGVNRENFSRFLNKEPAAERAFLEGREGGKVSLRRIQWLWAKKSAAMAIWLGKQYLGQQESNRTEIGGIQEGVPINLEHGMAEGLTALLARARQAKALPSK